MPWVIGIDEAGYGPNLGPLVLTSVAVRVPDDPPPLWDALRPAVRRADEKDDGRLLIDDSKKVNNGTKGLERLERGVLACLCPQAATEPVGLGGYVERHGLVDSLTHLASEPWFDGKESLPVQNPAEQIAAHAERCAAALGEAGLAWGPMQSVVVPAGRFNTLLDERPLKSDVLIACVIELLKANRRNLPGTDRLTFAVDRLGGRSFYAPLIQAAFPEGWVYAIREGADESAYMVVGLEREVFLSFRPRAEGVSPNVALASMASKYLREVCMRQFNRFWQARVPDLKPTAGYPVDAARFLADIRGALQAHGIAESAVWRRK